jgi:predicted regulator of Ras-like GTPase activity (Roadblock/LC7/MglB family)
MKDSIAPLATLPGVTLAMLVSQDGVPIVVRGEHRGDSTDTFKDAHLEDADALAGLAAGWIADVTRASAPISWNAPRYLVLRAARGSLLAMQVPRALLVVVLGSGMRPADFRLAMESAAGRVERSLRTGHARQEAAAEASAAAHDPWAEATAPRAEPTGARVEPTESRIVATGPQAPNTEPSGIFPERFRTPPSGVDPNRSTTKDGVRGSQGPTGE